MGECVYDTRCTQGVLIVLLCDSGKDSEKNIAECKLVVLVLAMWRLDIIRDNVKNRTEEVNTW